ncbi:MAG TPA: T9SS type A sorting domain-containing protein, partial [Candidatus Kapabacteria bacterium]|nr:T9SS type A sorting domain-containing protein [Candidatus Kapabacteria bacterium]
FAPILSIPLRSIVVDATIYPFSFSNTIVIKNSGNTTLVIDSTVATDSNIILRSPTFIPAGSSVLAIVNDSDAVFNPGTSFIYIYTNDPSHPIDTISVRNTLPGIAIFSDTVIVDLSKYPENYIDSIPISNTGNATLFIDSITSRNSSITTVGPDSIPADSYGYVTISINDRVIYSGVEHLYISTNDPLRPVDTVTILIKSPISSVPGDTVHIDLTAYPTAYSDTITISNIGNETLFINSITSSDASIKTINPDSVAAGNISEIAFSVNDSRAPIGVEYFFISTNDPRHPVDTITLLVSSPITNISGDTILINVALYPDSYSDTLAISNTGNETLTIDSTQWNDPSIAVSVPDSITAGNSGEVIISANDHTIQNGIEHLLIGTNDPRHAVDTITIIIQSMTSVATQDIPVSFGLLQNYPDPFSGETNFSFRLPAIGTASLKIYNMLGEEVATPVSGEFSAGEHTAKWNAGALPHGLYFYRLRSGAFSATRQMLLMK